MTTAFALFRAYWFVMRPCTVGASAFCVTPDGKLLLVYTTYERNWNLPCGGVKLDESPKASLLRELREEIGLTQVDHIAELGTIEHRPNFKRDTEHVFILTGVSLLPRSNLEIERIGAFEMDALPSDLSDELVLRIALLKRQMSGASGTSGAVHRSVNLRGLAGLPDTKIGRSAA